MSNFAITAGDLLPSVLFFLSSIVLACSGPFYLFSLGIQSQFATRIWLDSELMCIYCFVFYIYLYCTPVVIGIVI